LSDAPALDADLTLSVGAAERAFAVTARLRLERGLLVLFGPSGAGKSLTLQALAGLVQPRAGFVRAGARALFDAAARLDVPAHERRFGYVPQHHSLFPFLDVEGNVAFGLPRRERARGGAAVAEVLAELGLTHLARSRPDALSGGERQRVALARALVVRPSLLLLDEPFASIDHDGRAALRSALRAALERHGISAVLVTHDAEEALELGTALTRFERGRTVETGTPADLLGRERAACPLCGRGA
jgi:molybdate transport system ATP-binding protein